LNDGRYEPREFKGNELIVSQTFPELNLSSEQLLSAQVKADKLVQCQVK
jgi:Uma2 family endonuclease